jgi:hypothetical protein
MKMGLFWWSKHKASKVVKEIKQNGRIFQNIKKELSGITSVQLQAHIKEILIGLKLSSCMIQNYCISLQCFENFSCLLKKDCFWYSILINSGPPMCCRPRADDGHRRGDKTVTIHIFKECFLSILNVYGWESRNEKISSTTLKKVKGWAFWSLLWRPRNTVL